MDKDKIWVFDNIINKDIQEQIKSILTASNFPWYFIKDITDADKGKQLRPGFQHIYVKDKVNIKPLNEIQFYSILNNVCDKIGFKYSKVSLGRSFLQLPLGLIDNIPDSPNIKKKEKHLVVLYYVVDSDGDTVIYNNKSIPDNKKFTELKRVTPKQGTAVVFDGGYYHTAEQPKDYTRVIINYNLT